MSKDHISVKLECPKCHVAPHVDDENDDASAVYCPSCNALFGTYGDVKAKAMGAAKEEMQGVIRKAFEGRKGFKFK